MSPRRVHRFLGSAAACIVVLAAVVAAEPLLLVRTAIEPADVIVVLGGDALLRAAKAATLYGAGAARRVLVSGDGDCEDARRVLIDGGVAAQAIQVECKSGNTWENARLSAPMLTAMGARSAILVTSWFHTRRALACFGHFSPQVRWMSAPVEPAEPVSWPAASIEYVRVIEEYVKIGWYAIHYGLIADPPAAVVTHSGAESSG